MGRAVGKFERSNIIWVVHCFFILVFIESTGLWSNNFEGSFFSQLSKHLLYDRIHVKTSWKLMVVLKLFIKNKPNIKKVK